MPVEVIRNDAISIAEVGKYYKIILSPGPGLPAEAGILQNLIRYYEGKIPIFGVCLGLQAIGEVLGCQLKNLSQVHHGVQESMFVTDRRDPMLHNLPSMFEAGRYHSWVIDRTSTHNCPLRISCTDQDGEIMAMYHPEKPIFGVQFHPESIMTERGYQIMQNFLDI